MCFLTIALSKESMNKIHCNTNIVIRRLVFDIMDCETFGFE